MKVIHQHGKKIVLYNQNEFIFDSSACSNLPSSFSGKIEFCQMHIWIT